MDNQAIAPFLIDVEGHPDFDLIQWAMRRINPKIRVRSIYDFGVYSPGFTDDPKFLSKLDSFTGFLGVVYTGKKPTKKQIIEMVKSTKKVPTTYCNCD